MTSLYILTRYLTFPGALLKGFWQQIVCRICKVPVEDNRYLRNDEMCGNIEHEFMPKASGAFALCFVPAFMNGLLCLFLCVIPEFVMLLGMGGVLLKIASVVSYWFAFSLYVNSYPLIEDAMNMMNKVYKHGNILQKIIYAPGAVCLYVGAYLERYNITFLLSAIGTIFLILY